MKIHLSNAELKSIGCKNCIWLLHGQCPNNISKGETYMPKDRSKAPEGICIEYLDFITSFADEDDSISVLWEKFALYIARLQSLDDYKEFINKKSEIENERKFLEPKDRMQLDIQLNTLRLWWERLNETVMKGYGKIADREGRANEGNKLPGIMNAKTINFNVTKQVEDKNGK